MCIAHEDHDLVKGFDIEGARRGSQTWAVCSCLLNSRYTPSKRQSHRVRPITSTCIGSVERWCSKCEAVRSNSRVFLGR